MLHFVVFVVRELFVARATEKPPLSRNKKNETAFCRIVDRKKIIVIPQQKNTKHDVSHSFEREVHASLKMSVVQRKRQVAFARSYRKVSVAQQKTPSCICVRTSTQVKRPKRHRLQKSGKKNPVEEKRKLKRKSVSRFLL